MFCTHCGNQMRDDAKFCQSCGAPINDSAPTQPVYQAQYQPQQSAPNSQENAIAIVGFVLAFFVPLAGLICSIIGYNNSKKGGKYGGLALAGMIIGIVFLILGIIAAILIVIFLSYYLPYLPYLYY